MFRYSVKTRENSGFLIFSRQHGDFERERNGVAEVVAKDFLFTETSEEGVGLPQFFRVSRSGIVCQVFREFGLGNFCGLCGKQPLPTCHIGRDVNARWTAKSQTPAVGLRNCRRERGGRSASGLATCAPDC